MKIRSLRLAANFFGLEGGGIIFHQLIEGNLNASARVPILQEDLPDSLGKLPERHVRASGRQRWMMFSSSS
jgi:hypothetical protein